MSFESRIVAFADRFLSDRTFRLVVAPALADLEFEDAAGRRSPFGNRVPVLRAVAGGLRRDLLDSTGVFVKLSLLSACYFLFPIAMAIKMFKTWPEFFLAATLVLGVSMVPVLVCFWPARHTPRLD